MQQQRFQSRARHEWTGASFPSSYHSRAHYFGIANSLRRGLYARPGKRIWKKHVGIRLREKCGLSTQHISKANVVNEESNPRLYAPILVKRVMKPVRRLSPWTRSAGKRIFDCTCVLLSLPFLVPVFALVALAVRLTSRGPVLFQQKRMGTMGRSFTILKFRTMLHAKEPHRAVATVNHQGFTSIGRFLRRWKLDELPQLLNVLSGHMSLVGPRPKMMEHSTFELHCRPGITGAATVAFAREEAALNRVPPDHIDELYHAVVLPAKQSLDDDYMARATLFTDLELIVKTVLRRWDSAFVEKLLFDNPVRVQRSRQHLAPCDQPAVTEDIRQAVTEKIAWRDGYAES